MSAEVQTLASSALLGRSQPICRFHALMMAALASADCAAPSAIISQAGLHTPAAADE